MVPPQENKDQPNASPLRIGEAGPFVFIHINKTGGTSIAEAIGLPRKKHMTVKEVINEIGETEWLSAYKFTVVRNPWDKVVSHFNYRVKRNLHNLASDHVDFNDWVRGTYGPEKHPVYYNNPRMFQPQVDWLKNHQGKIEIDEVIRFEALQQGFDKVAKHIGVEPQLPHLNRTTQKKRQIVYSDESREHIARWFKADLEFFGYSFDNAG